MTHEHYMWRACLLATYLIEDNTHHVHDLDEGKSEMDHHVVCGIEHGSHTIVVFSEHFVQQSLLVWYTPLI